MRAEVWASCSEDEKLEVIRNVTLYDEDAPVLCRSGHDCDCEVGPDGHCQHGCPSVLITEGVI